MHSVSLSLGSNKPFLSEGEEFSPHIVLKNAVKELGKKIQNISVSSLYLTKPMYYENQEYFHNIVIFATFEGSPEDLLAFTQSVECKFGRNRDKEIRNGPRCLDIDILLFSNIERNTNNLIIPHPKMHERAFVLIPMLEIFPKCADTNKREYYTHCLNQLNSEDVKKIAPL